MTRAWRIVLWAAVVLLALGAVLFGAGWLTGGSVSRIVDLAFGGRAGLLAEVRAAETWLRSILDSVRTLI